MPDELVIWRRKRFLRRGSIQQYKASSRVLATSTSFYECSCHRKLHRYPGLLRRGQALACFAGVRACFAGVRLASPGSGLVFGVGSCCVGMWDDFPIPNTQGWQSLCLGPHASSSPVPITTSSPAVMAGEHCFTTKVTANASPKDFDRK